MFGMRMQPGFRFHPTDVELVLYYLKRKIMGKPLHCNVIAELDLYKFPPWDMAGKSLLQSNDLEWYFFCPRDKKYSCGSRTNRSTDTGFWKSTGKDREIVDNSRTVGTKKTLIFHIGRIPQGERTNWVMHEYRLENSELANAGLSSDSYVLCKVFQKSGPGPKNGEQYGAPFKEEDWENSEVSGEPCMSMPIEPTDGSQLLQEPLVQQCAASQVPLIPCNSDVERFSEQLYEDCGIASCTATDNDPSLTHFDAMEMLQQLFDEPNNNPLISETTNAELSEISTLPTSFAKVFSSENFEKDELPELTNATEQEQNNINEMYQNLEELEPIDGLYFSDIMDNEHDWPPMLAASGLQYMQQQNVHFWERRASLATPGDIILQETVADNSKFQESRDMVVPSFRSINIYTSSLMPGGSHPKGPTASYDQKKLFPEVDCLEVDAASAARSADIVQSAPF